MSSLLEKIKDRSANVVVVGAGYVGLPLAVEIAKAGFSVTAYDRSNEKVSAINAGRSYIDEVPTAVVGPTRSSPPPPTRTCWARPTRSSSASPPR
jgi:UDP-N-acetyl-D-glucosamine dehydrogenase